MYKRLALFVRVVARFTHSCQVSEKQDRHAA